MSMECVCVFGSARVCPLHSTVCSARLDCSYYRPLIQQQWQQWKTSYRKSCTTMQTNRCVLLGIWKLHSKRCWPLNVRHTDVMDILAQQNGNSQFLVWQLHYGNRCLVGRVVGVMGMVVATTHPYSHHHHCVICNMTPCIDWSWEISHLTFSTKSHWTQFI